MHVPKSLTLLSLGGLLWSIIFFGGIFSVADELTPGVANLWPGDCLLANESYIQNGKFSNIETHRNQPRQQNIIDQASLNVAFLNLKKACCDNAKNIPLYCGDDQWAFNPNVPQSYYLFDHLLDVLLRRLEGENAYPNITTLDPKGEEWRKFTNEIALSTDGIPVQNITKKYETFRTIDGNNTIEEGITQKIENSKNEYINPAYPGAITTGENLKILQKYSELTLGERYDNICNIARYLYLLFSANDENIKTVQTVLLENKNGGQTNACSSLIQQRKEAESTYVETLTHKGNTLLVNNIKQYMNVYLDKRLFDLQTTLQNISTSFLRVTKAIDKLVPICTS
jgi:hypothetical protein